MLTAEGCAARRKRLWDALPGECDVLVLADPQSLIYFANFFIPPFVFRASDAGGVLVLERDRATLVTDAMVKVYADGAHVDDVVAPVWYDGRHAAPHRRLHLARTAREVLAKLGGPRFGLETASVPEGLLEPPGGARATVELDTIVHRLRRAKDPDEVALIRHSIRAGEAGHAAALEGIRPGMTELEAFALVQKAATEAAGEPVVVYGDFASGPRCETERGGPPTHRTIAAGDLFLLDYSVVVHGYRGDFTNTFVVGGTPTPGQRRLFDACVGAIAAGESALRAGAPAPSIDLAVRKHLRSLDLEAAFPSHSGHGLGLSHPEPPYFVRESDETVVDGDVVAIEPGLFVDGVGGMRFEHNYRVTADGFERLTNHRITLEP
jgi:Xaa-Pro aminopeptidase